MEYTGKLYGKIGNKYFDTGYTSEDYDKLQKENSELQKQVLNIPVVSGSTEINTPLTYCPKCKSTDIRQYTKGQDKCNKCNHVWDIYRPFK